MAKDRFDGSQGTPPQPPFIEVTHEHAVRPDAAEETLDLEAALPRPQAEMCRDDLYGDPAARQIEVDGAPWLVGRHAEIDEPDITPLTACKNRIAVMALALEECWASNDLVLRFLT